MVVHSQIILSFLKEDIIVKILLLKTLNLYLLDLFHLEW